MKVLMMAGGTGGHVFPGLAIANVLRQTGAQVEWLGTEIGIENVLVPKAGIPLHLLKIGGVQKNSRWRRILNLFVALFAVMQALIIIRKLRPDCIITMGGFSSGPGAMAARLLNIPVFLHEQNAAAGLTNRIVSHFAKIIFIAFPDSFKRNIPTKLVGNPVRKELIELPLPTERLLKVPHRLRILILGGSQGARFLNQLMPQVISQIASDIRPMIVHQTGKKDLTDTQIAYEKAGINATTVAFIDEMADAYAHADLVICRSGALTVSELMAVGLGSILIPYPGSADDHQTKNAKYLAAANAAIIIQQSACSIDVMVKTINQLQNSREQLLAMAEAAYALRQIEAAEKIVQMIKTSLG